MGEHMHNQGINKALFGPPLSPKFTKTTSLQPFQSQPPTPDAVNNKLRPASISPGDTTKHDPSTKKTPTDNSEGSSSMDDLIGKVEEMVKMLKRVGRKKELVSDPLLGCFVAAQTVLMACTAELMMSRPKKKAKRPLDHQRSDTSINYSSITTDEAAHGNRKNKKFKKSNSTN